MATKTLYDQFKCITCKLCVDMGRPADLYDVEMYKEHYRDAHCKDVRMYWCVACGPSASFSSPCHAIHHLKRKCKQSVPIVTAANPNQDAFAVTGMHIIDWDGMKDMQDAVNHGIREALKREYERGLAVGRAEQAAPPASSAPSAPPSLPASSINHQRPESASETASEAASTAPLTFSKKQTARRPKRPRDEREREEKRRKMEFGYMNVKREAVTPEPVEQPLPSSLNQQTQTDTELKEQEMQTEEKEQFDQIIQTEQERKEQVTQTEKGQSPEQMTQTEQEQKEQCVQTEKEEEERPEEETEAKYDLGLQCLAWCGDIQQSSPVFMPPRQKNPAPAPPAQPAPAPAPASASTAPPPPAPQLEQTMEEVFEQMEAEAKMRRREKKQKKALTAEEMLERELDLTGPVIQDKNTIRRGKKHDPAVELLLEREVMGVVEEREKEEEKEKEEGDENMETEMDSELEQVEQEMEQKAREKLREKRRELRRSLPVHHKPTSAFQPLKMRMDVGVEEDCCVAAPSTPVHSPSSAASTPRTPSHTTTCFAPLAPSPSIDCGYSSAASEASPAYEREEEGQGDPRLTAREYQKRTCASVQLRSQRDRKKAGLRRRVMEEGIEFQEFIRQIRPLYTLEKHIVSNELQELEKWLDSDRGREEMGREVSRKRGALSACRSFEDEHCLVCDGGHTLQLFERSLLVPYTFDDGRIPLVRGITVRPVHHQDVTLLRDMPMPPPTPRSPVSTLPPPPKRFA